MYLVCFNQNGNFNALLHHRQLGYDYSTKVCYVIKN